MSKIGFISDIHSNLTALTQALELLAIHRVDEIVCLGDVVGYGPEPVACLNRVRDQCSTIIQGNHDAALADEYEYCRMNRLAMAGVDHARKQLDLSNVMYLMSRARMMVFPEKDLTLTHGSLTEDHFEYILDGRSAYENFLLMKTRYLLVGHSHLAFMSELKSRAEVDEGLLFMKTFRLEGEVVVQLNRDSKYIINPGSVGQPRDIPLGSLCILDNDNNTVTYIRFPYDIKITKEKIIKVGLPDWAWQRLEKGR